MKRLFLFLIFMMVIPALGIAGTAYYVDPTAPGGGNGSFAKPWNNISQINAKTFSTGDSVYFKVNTTLKPNNRLFVRWSGTENNRVTIGAYHGNGLFGLRPGDRHPRIDQQVTSFTGDPPANNIHPGDYSGMITVNGSFSYITVRDLEFRNHWGGGVRFDKPSGSSVALHNHLINCRFINMGRAASVVQRQHYAIVDGNYIDISNRRKVELAKGKYSWGGAAIEITAGNNVGESMHNLIINNTLTRTTESIGIYKGARYTTVRNNTIYNFESSAIYMSNSEYAIIEENLVYQPEERWPWWDHGRMPLIWLNSEAWVASHVKQIGWVTIRNNYLAGGSAGVFVTSHSQAYDIHPKHIRIYGNRIVDCEMNFYFVRNDSNWHDIYVYGNYSFLYTNDSQHTSHMSPAGVTWGVSAEKENDYSLFSTGKIAPNFFNTGVATVTGNAAKNAEFNMVSFIKERNWRSLIAGEVTRDWFKLTNEMQDQVPPPKVKNVAAVPATK